MLLAKGRSDNLSERRTPPEAEDTARTAQQAPDREQQLQSGALGFGPSIL